MIETGNRNFWKAQLIGWGIIMLSNFLIQLIAGLPTDLLIYNAIMDKQICK